MEYKMSGSSGAYSAAVSEADVYLQLASIGKTIIGYYAVTPDNWIRAGRKGNYLPSARIGIGATNAEPGTVSQDLLARFDYILVSLSE